MLFRSLLESADRGRSWSSIAGDLPNGHVVWTIVEDHLQPELLFVGTEFGLYFTLDGGERWEKRPAEFSMKVSEDMPEFFPWWEDRPFE
mgnify:CR=1 FL=1